MTSKILRAAAVILAAVSIALVLNACADSPLRFRIIANSDSAADQRVKLEVRDAVLAVTKDAILKCESAGEAEEYIRENIEIIERTANETLTSRGFDYNATVTLGKCLFPEKSYKGVTYPEGEYEALKIVLGRGEGENWWCVVFPPLCLYETEDSGENPEDTQYTSLLAELWGALFGG